MKRNAWASAIFAVAMVIGMGGSARAVDGTIEINQAKWNATCATPPCPPYAISTPGSYRLTGNLTASGGKDAIDVSASNVTIDLNGFTISGSGGGAGINGNPSSASTPPSAGTTVENGTITGFGSGIYQLGGNSTVKNVHADSNEAYGINVGINSVVKDSTANNNSGGPGIFVSKYTVVEGCTANNNSSGDGIQCFGDGCAISGNTANNNNPAGIECNGNGCVILGNTLTVDPYGIKIDSSAGLIVHNAIFGSGIDGIYANDTTTAYGENVLATSVCFSLGKSIGNNVCNSNIQ